MKRIHKNMATAAVLLVAGLGFGYYTLQTKVKTPEERFLADRESKRLFRFGRVDVKRGSLQAKNATVTFERDGAGWNITKPIAWPADDEAIDAALDRMASIIMEPVTTENATAEDVEREGLDKPTVTMTVELADGVEYTLHVGRRNRLTDKYPITAGDKKRIGLSDSAFYWAMDRPFDELRDKHLVHIPEDDVTGITVFAPDGGVRYRLEKDGEGWTTEGDGQPKIEADPGDVLLARVRIVKRLTAATFLTDTYDAAQQAEYGLDAPKARIEVTSKDGATTKLVFAEHPKQEGQHLIHVEGTGTVAEVAGSLEELLEKTAVQFRDRTFYSVDRRAVQTVQFEQGTAKFVVKRKGDDWLIDGKPAKIWKVDSVLRAFAHLKVDAIHARDATKSQQREWLIDPPSRRLVFRDADDKVLTAVRFGKYARDEFIFVKSESDERIGLITDKKVDLLPTSVEELADEER